jgi:hypothetical protein
LAPNKNIRQEVFPSLNQPKIKESVSASNGKHCFYADNQIETLNDIKPVCRGKLVFHPVKMYFGIRIFRGGAGSPNIDISIN